MQCMRNERRQPKPDLETENFDSAVVQAAYTHHLQIGAGDTEGSVPVGVAAFIAGVSWARQVLLRGENK